MTNFKCMHKPSSKHHKVYELKLEGKTTKEISEILGISITRVNEMAHKYLDWLEYQHLKFTSPTDNLMYLDLCDKCNLSRHSVLNISIWCNCSILELSKQTPETLSKIIRYLTFDKAGKVIDLAKEYVNKHIDYYKNLKIIEG